MKNPVDQKNQCKICNATDITIFAHTAKCNDCGVLLYYPYPLGEDDPVLDSVKSWDRKGALRWYSDSSFKNHNNFTGMLRYTIDELNLGKSIDVLDYGGGGGQFALICKSHFPEANIFIVDIADNALLDEWRIVNNQIKFKDFNSNEQKFDFIFMNDVFEHVNDPVSVLKQLASKLKAGGKIFIDTPKQFWLYPISKLLSQNLYAKILRGTVSTMHLQIWTRKSFDYVVRQSGLRIEKYCELSEYTMPAKFYMDNMKLTNPIIRFVGFIFYKYSNFLAKNKILSVLVH